MAATLRFPTVLFDLDGTLTDPRVGITNGMQHALATIGVLVEDPDTLVSSIGPPIHDALAELADVAPDRIDQAVGAYRAYYRDQGMYENVVHPGVPELLATLHDAGALVALATSKPDQVAADILCHFELASWFAFVGGSSLDGARRTKAEVINHTLAAIGRTSVADRSRTVIVGDREHDVLGAKAAGIASIGVRWGYAAPGELEDADADAIASDVGDLRSRLLV